MIMNAFCSYVKSISFLNLSRLFRQVARSVQAQEQFLIEYDPPCFPKGLLENTWELTVIRNEVEQRIEKNMFV